MRYLLLILLLTFSDHIRTTRALFPLQKIFTSWKSFGGFNSCTGALFPLADGSSLISILSGLTIPELHLQKSVIRPPRTYRLEVDEFSIHGWTATIARLWPNNTVIWARVFEYFEIPPKITAKNVNEFFVVGAYTTAGKHDPVQWTEVTKFDGRGEMK